MYPFTYMRAKSVRAAANALARNEDAKLLAGGHTLLPTLKLRLANPAELIDISELPELKGIAIKGRNLVIGAGTTHAEIAGSAAVEEFCPAFAELAGSIGDPAVRHRGTIGGSIANNDPAADYPSAMLALGATIVTNKRKIAADDFFLGLFETALEPGEIIVRVQVPQAKKAGYMKIRNPASRYALVGVFVAKKSGGVRVGVTGAGSNGAFRWTAAEEALSKRLNPKSLDGLTVDAADMNGDIHASAEYRAHLVGVMAKRAVEAMR